MINATELLSEVRCMRGVYTKGVLSVSSPFLRDKPGQGHEVPCLDWL